MLSKIFKHICIYWSHNFFHHTLNLSLKIKKNVGFFFYFSSSLEDGGHPYVSGRHLIAETVAADGRRPGLIRDGARGGIGFGRRLLAHFFVESGCFLLSSDQRLTNDGVVLFEPIQCRSMLRRALLVEVQILRVFVIGKHTRGTLVSDSSSSNGHD